MASTTNSDWDMHPSSSGLDAWTLSAGWSESAADRAANYIRSLVFSGQLRPGDRLPAGRDLSERLGISRVTLTLGLKALETEGYIEIRKGSRGGPAVLDAVGLLRCWRDWARRNSDEVDDIFRFRTTVETKIAALAAEQRTSAELERLEAAEAMYSDNRESLFRWDVAFHDSIAEAAHSPRLRSAMIAVRGELFLPVDQALLEHSTEQVHSHHEAIVAAVRDREPRRAGDEMLAHIEHIRTMVFRAIAESGRS